MTMGAGDTGQVSPLPSLTANTLTHGLSSPPPLQMADEAVCIGEAPSSESYLNVPNLLAAAVSRGAQAVHPVSVTYKGQTQAMGAGVGVGGGFRDCMRCASIHGTHWARLAAHQGTVAYMADPVCGGVCLQANIARVRAQCSMCGSYEEPSYKVS